MLVNIGYGNVVNMDKVVSIIKADAAPIKRMVQAAKDNNLAVDATCGRKTKCVLVMESGHIVLSALLSETIENRAEGLQTAEGSLKGNSCGYFRVFWSR